MSGIPESAIEWCIPIIRSGFANLKRQLGAGVFREGGSTLSAQRVLSGDGQDAIRGMQTWDFYP